MGAINVAINFTAAATPKGGSTKLQMNFPQGSPFPAIGDSLMLPHGLFVVVKRTFEWSKPTSDLNITLLLDQST